MTKILNSMINIIMVPIDWVVAKMVYWLLILWPLKILNALDNAINFITGAGVERILFGVNNVDGKIDIDFFASDSPLKTFYLISIGIGSTLLILFFGFKIAHNLFSAKYKNIIKQSSKTLAVGSIVFIIPAIFITLLSLVSSLISLISGGNPAVGTQDINQFRASNKTNINNIQTFNDSSNIFDQNITNLYNLKTGKRDANKNIEEIYQDFESLPQNDSLKILAKKNFQGYEEIKKKIKGIILKSHLSKMKTIINNLKIKEKDENKAQQIKDANNYFASINYRISLFVKTANQIIDQAKLDPQGKKQQMVANYQNFFVNHFYGKKDDIKNQANTNIKNIYVTNVKSFTTALGILKDNPHGTLVLSNVLSDYPDSSLAVTFYQLATGSKNSDWENDFNINTKDLANGQLFFGSVLIIAACGFLVTICFMALVRLIDLALLITISPIPVFIAPIDGGERVSLWIKAFSEELLSILGAIIVLRLLGPLGTSYRNFLNINQGFLGDHKLFLLAFFYIASLIAAQKAILTIASIFGIGEGIFASMNLDRSFGVIASMKGYRKAVVSYYVKGTKGTFFMGLNGAKRSYKFGKSMINKFRNHKDKVPKAKIPKRIIKRIQEEKTRKFKMALRTYTQNKKQMRLNLLNKSQNIYKNLKVRHKLVLSDIKIELRTINNTFSIHILNKKWMKKNLSISMKDYEKYQEIFKKPLNKELRLDEVMLIKKYISKLNERMETSNHERIKSRMIFNYLLFNKLKSLQQNIYTKMDKNQMKMAKIITDESKNINNFKNRMFFKNPEKTIMNKFDILLNNTHKDNYNLNKTSDLLNNFIRKYQDTGKGFNNFEKHVNKYFDNNNNLKQRLLYSEKMLLWNKFAFEGSKGNSNELFFKRQNIQEININNKIMNPDTIAKIKESLNARKNELLIKKTNNDFKKTNSTIVLDNWTVQNLKNSNRVNNSLAWIERFKSSLDKIKFQDNLKNPYISSKREYQSNDVLFNTINKKTIINKSIINNKHIRFMLKKNWMSDSITINAKPKLQQLNSNPFKKIWNKDKTKNKSKEITIVDKAKLDKLLFEQLKKDWNDKKNKVEPNQKNLKLVQQREQLWLPNKQTKNLTNNEIKELKSKIKAQQENIQKLTWEIMQNKGNGKELKQLKEKRNLHINEREKIEKELNRKKNYKKYDYDPNFESSDFPIDFNQEKILKVKDNLVKNKLKLEKYSINNKIKEEVSAINLGIEAIKHKSNFYDGKTKSFLESQINVLKWKKINMIERIMKSDASLESESSFIPKLSKRKKIDEYELPKNFNDLNLMKNLNFIKEVNDLNEKPMQLKMIKLKSKIIQENNSIDRAWISADKLIKSKYVIPIRRQLINQYILDHNDKLRYLKEKVEILKEHDLKSKTIKKTGDIDQIIHNEIKLNNEYEQFKKFNFPFSRLTKFQKWERFSQENDNRLLDEKNSKDFILDLNKKNHKKEYEKYELNNKFYVNAAIPFHYYRERRMENTSLIRYNKLRDYEKQEHLKVDSINATNKKE